MRIELGKRVPCADDHARKVVDVVLDAGSHRVTHLVVQPDDELEARLVPIELAYWPAEGKELSLRCNAATLEQLEPVSEFAYVRPGDAVQNDPKWDVGVEDYYPTSYYNPSDFGAYVPELDPGVGIRYDRVPKGEIELRHASDVYSSEREHLGRVEGVLVDGNDLVTHLLLERGHLWWRREVAVPVDAVAKFETDVVHLRASKRDLSRFRSRRLR
jgi:hypothetical protein